MEAMTRRIDDSMARLGFGDSLDHRRLQWSAWFHCESSLSLLQMPSAAGIYTLGEEIVPPGEALPAGGKRILAVFQIAEAEDLCLALSRHFASPNPLSERLASGRCFVRFAQVADAAYRQTACKGLNQWLASSAEAATGMAMDSAAQLDLPSSPSVGSTGSRISATDSGPPPLPAGF